MNGVYTVTTGVGRSADDAAKDLFPEGVETVLIKTETWGQTVKYHFLVA